MVPAGAAGKQRKADSTAQMDYDGLAFPTDVETGALQRQSWARIAACEAQRAEHEGSVRMQNVLEAEAKAQQEHPPGKDSDAATSSMQQGRHQPNNLLPNSAMVRQDNNPIPELAMRASTQRSQRERTTSVRLSDICNGPAEREAAKLAELKATACRQTTGHAVSMRGRSLAEAEAAAPPTSNATREQAPKVDDRKDAVVPADSPVPPAKRQKLEEAPCAGAASSAQCPRTTPAGFVLKAVDNGLPRLRLFWTVSCAHGDFWMDRLAEVQAFLRGHRACAPGWEALAPEPGEPEAQHAQRIGPLFRFNRTADTPVVRVEPKMARLPDAAGAATAVRSTRKPSHQLQQPKAPKAPLAQQAAAPTLKTPAPNKEHQHPQQQKKSVQKAQPLPQFQARSQQAEREAGQKLRGSGGDSLEQWEAEKAMEALQPKLRAALEVFQQGRLDVRIFMEVDVATAIAPGALVGRQVRVLWPEDNAWFLGTVGSYDPGTGEHQVVYEDDDSEGALLAAERVRLEVSAPEALPPPSPADLRATAGHLRARAVQEAQCNEARAAELVSQADALELLAEEQNGQAAEAPGSVEEEEPDQAGAPRLGDVVWAKEKGWPAWPALVITRETARGLSAIRWTRGGVAVWYFSTREMGCARPDNIKGFAQGLTAGAHVKCKRSPAQFRRALFEASSGKLPDAMILDSNDERWFCDDDGEGPPGADLADCVLPLRLGKTLTVEALGRVDYMRPGFHCKKYIWPLGFSAVRTVTVPGTGGKPSRQLSVRCQILVSPDGDALFRVTPDAGKRVESTEGATVAWRSLLAREGGRAGDVARLSGPRLFGLDNRTVQRLVQALRHAPRCARFDAWLGPRPEAEPLSAAEEQERARLEADVQRLPPGMHPVPAPCLPQGMCSACGEEDETGDNHLLQCDACRLFVHMDCYGVADCPEGRSWLCDVCSLGLSRPPVCALCPVEGGPMKRTACGRWVHSACELWIPETALDVERGVVDGLQLIHKARFQLACSLCSQAHGACIQCAGSRQCFSAFHPLCARRAGLHMVAIRDESDSDSDDDLEPPAANTQSQNATLNCANTAANTLPGAATVPEAAAKGQNAIVNIMADSSRPAPAPPVLAASGASADALAAIVESETTQERQVNCKQEQQNGQTEQEQEHARQAEGLGSRPQDCVDRAQACKAVCCQAESRPSSTTACATDAAQQLPATEPPGKARDGGGGKFPAARPQGVRKRAWREGTALGAGLRLMAYCARHSRLARADVAEFGVSIATGRLLQQGPDSPRAPAPQPAPLPCPTPAPGSCPAAAKEPPRTQQQGAAAGTGGGAAGDSSGQEGPCARCQAFGQARRGRRAPDALAVALAKRAFVRAVPYCVGFAPRRPHLLPSAAGRAPAAEKRPPSLQLPAGAAAGGNAGCRTPAPSLAQRFEAMTRTVPQRLTCGKSAIHGWGAFAKVGHAPGDLLIEYMGELVRRSVADTRERRAYDTLVGVGTYVFGLSADACVDATRAGNMAHLLNHSCEPNAYSRTISVRCPATSVLADHVVICAARAIAAGEELTYNYRFSGQEELPCNCGAARCRGYVNLAKAHADKDIMRVARHRLKPYVQTLS